jgi:hypothetical protein
LKEVRQVRIDNKGIFILTKSLILSKQTGDS